MKTTLRTEKKVSQLKYAVKVRDELDLDMRNLNDLKAWLNQHHQANVNNDSFASLDWNEPFVADLQVYEDNFVAFSTTKNLVYNIVKQQNMDLGFICADGTYKLNNLSYPTIVVGAVDLFRRFHLGNYFYLIFILIKNSWNVFL